MAAYLAACREQPQLDWPTNWGEPGAIGQAAAKARHTMVSIGRLCGFPSRSGGYVCEYVVRKLLVAQLVLAAGQGSHVDWDATPLAVLREVAPDESEFLQSLPAAWSASEASAFMFGRPDWGIFISMFGCLFKEVADQYPVAVHGQIEEACGSVHLRTKAELHRTRTSCAPRPAEAVRLVLADMPPLRP